MTECFTLCLEQTLDQCGGIDILVSNAAVNPFFGNIMDSTEDVWDKVRTKDEAPHFTFGDGPPHAGLEQG